MKDLTSGSIPRHLVSMSIQMAIGILVQTLYYVVDLYFVSQLGDEAIAGVGAAGNIWFVVLALTMILSVGTVALVSHAVGAQDRARANRAFNQALSLSAVVGVFVIIGVTVAAAPYMRAIGADEPTARAGIEYLYWYAPGLGLQFGIVAMSAALRGTGIVKPTMLLQMVTVLVNIVLAPVLIAGWGTGHAMGAGGAGLASSISVMVGVLLFGWYFRRHEKYVGVSRSLLAQRPDLWRRLVTIGLPVGLEFVLISIVMVVIYWVIRDFGSAAQAGFGVGQRVMQSIMLPAMAVSFAAAPIAGQNFGARRFDRVRETFRWSLILGVSIMLLLTLLCQLEADWFMRVFTREAAVVAIGAQMLVISSWNFAANAVIFSCSSLFQAMGNTWPTIGSSLVRLVAFVLPVAWLSTRADFELHHVWYVSVFSMSLQAVVSWWLLRREFARRLPGPAPALEATR